MVSEAGLPIQMDPGKVYAINGKLYMICGRCGSLIRADKPIIGSLHLCD